MLKLIRTLAFTSCLFLLVSICPLQAIASFTSVLSKFSIQLNVLNSFSPSPLYSTKFKEWKLAEAGINATAFSYAIQGFNYMQQHVLLAKNNIISIIDFSKPSTEDRLFILNLETGKILFKTLVAHGKNTGQQYANDFSNEISSYASSQGFYITMDTYTGNNGYSLRLKGCEKGFNDKAQERHIVMHGADYVSERFIKRNGYLGRSHGCPAIPKEETHNIINTISNGSCLFIYHPNQKYLKQSRYLTRIL